MFSGQPLVGAKGSGGVRDRVTGTAPQILPLYIFPQHI